MVLLTKTAFKMQGQKLIAHSCVTRELIAWCEKGKKQRVKMDIKTKRKLKFGKSIGNQTTVLKNVAAMPVARTDIPFTYRKVRAKVLSARGQPLGYDTLISFLFALIVLQVAFGVRILSVK